MLEKKKRENRTEVTQKERGEGQFEVKQVRAGLAGTIADIKADPHLINKFRAKYKNETIAEAAAESVPGISQSTIGKL